MDKTHIGIDFGTTNSLVTIYKNGNYEVLSFDNDEKFLPSAVYFKEVDEVVVGSNAKKVEVIEPDLTITNLKRYIGSNKVYKIIENDFKAEEIAILIFKKIKNNIDFHLGKSEIVEAVITVPAYFNHIQRELIRASAEIAGIKVKLLLNEPTAAYIFYQHSLHIKSGKFLVIDLGGGTLDLSLIEADENYCKVIASIGSNKIGGNDFDTVIADYLTDKFYKKHFVDLKKNKIAYQQILVKSECVKKELNGFDESKIVIPFISNDGIKPLHFNETINRQEFINISKDLTLKIFELIQHFTFEQKESMNDIVSVLLIGGGVKLFLIENLIRDYFNIEVKKVVNSEESISKGAAIANYLLGSGNKFFQDVISHNLGIEDDNGFFQVMLEKYQSYPVEKTMLFTNSEDDLGEIIVHVLQEISNNSDSDTASINDRFEDFVSLGLVKFPLNKKVKKGEADISITFSIDKSAIVNVKVYDELTENEITFSLKSNFSVENIKNLKIL